MIAGNEETHNYFMGRRLISLSNLMDAIEQAAVCALCKKGQLTLNEKNVVGWASEMSFMCSNIKCDKNPPLSAHSFPTSHKVGNQFDVNKSMVLSLRCIRKGTSAASKFSAVMGLPKPVS